MGVAMYVIRELEDAIDDCRASETKRNADGVNAVDEAVAFYTGSLEGADGAGSGVLMYALADKRCVNFKTCGENGDSITGTSDANLEIFDEFKDIKSNVLAKNCDAAVGDKEDIVEDMRIPLIQGTLRYAQILSTDEADAVDKAEGAIFALSILPWLDNCNQDAAKTVFENMSPTATSKVSLSAVKKAIESTYKCLEVSCEDIGGLYDEATGKYLEGSSPCSGDSGVNVGLAVGLSVGGLVVLALVLLFVKRQKAGGVEMKSDDV